MQAITPLTAADLLARSKTLVRKVEINVGGTWVNLCDLDGKNYLKKNSVSISPSGPGRLPDVIIGTWSATILNDRGIFHPFHPSSPYVDYFKIGREVRISIGAKFGGVARYWPWISGYMNAPKFNGKSRSVTISGDDYSKRLADLELRAPNENPEGYNAYWGDVATFDSISANGTGLELYAEADACTIGAGEADSVTPWAVGVSDGSVASVSGESSTYALEFTRDAPGPTEQYCQNAGITTMTAGLQYIISFKGAITAGTNYARLFAYETSGGTTVRLGATSISYAEGEEFPYQLVVISGSGGTLELRLSTGGKYATATDAVRIDEISIKTYDPQDWNIYELPEDCKGPYCVTLDNGDGLGAVPIFQGEDADDKQSWTYEESTRRLSLTKDMLVNAGTDNLKVYYYQTQVLENVVADILVAAGHYATRAAALAAMDYTATGVSIDRVWFETGTKAREAIRMICERVNYRFWRAYDGTPTFKPVSAAGASIFDFTSLGHIQATDEEQDFASLKNRVIIEGIERSMFTVREDRRTSRFSGEAVDEASADPDTGSGEHTMTITNHLFQDDASIATIAASMLALLKDPKWLSSVPVPFNVVPLEVGDTITWVHQFHHAPGGAGGDLSGGTFTETPDEDLDGGTFLGTPDADISGGTFLGETLSCIITGIIRTIRLAAKRVVYECEITDGELVEEHEGAAVVTGWGALTSTGAAGSGTTGPAYWVSPTGTALWDDAYSEEPLSGTDCTTLARATANAAAGDMVYFREGTYTIGSTGIAAAFEPDNSGTEGNPITFSAYSTEVPQFEQAGLTYKCYASLLNGISWVRMTGLHFHNFQNYGCWIYGGGSYNEIDHCWFTRDEAYGAGDRVIIIGEFSSPWSTHNWVHHNYIQGHHHTTPCNEAIDIIKVGGAQSSPYSEDDYNTIEDNFLEYSGHANIVTYSKHNVVRNNISHNEPWLSGCTSYQGATSTTSLAVGTGVKSLATQAGLAWSAGSPVTLISSADYSNAMYGLISSYDNVTGLLSATISATAGSGTHADWILSRKNVPFYTDTDYNGLYGHRVSVFGDSDIYHDNLNLIEGNRFGFGGVNPNNGGPSCLDIQSPRNIVRYNDVYGGMASGIYFKSADGDPYMSGGVNNRVYNNTIYHNGHGWDESVYGALNVTYNGNGIAQHSIHGGDTNNVIKNNIVYDNANGDICWMGTATPPQDPWTGDTVENNLTGTDPLFVDPDLTDPTSQDMFSTLGGYAATPIPDLRLQAGSPAIGAGDPLTLANGTGANTATLVVDDADYFQDGTRGSSLSDIQADWIAIGAVDNIVQISSINYATATITLASPMTWADNAPVWLYKKSDGVRVLYGTAPEQGAHPYIT